MSWNINTRKLGNLVPIIGIILFIYIIINIGVDKIFHTFSLIPLWYYIGALLVFIPKLFLAAYKWQYISRKQKMFFDFFYLVKLFLLSLFYAAITPGAVGIHIRVYYMKKKVKASFEKCIANSFIDGVSGVIGGIILATIGSLIYINLYPSLLPVLASFLVFYATAFIFFIEKRRGSKFFYFFIRPFLSEKYHTNFDKTIDALYEDIPSPFELIPIFLFELVIWTIAATQVYILAQAFSLHIPYPEFIIMNVISVVVATAIPISIGGLGVREGTFVVLLAQYNIPSEIAFVLSLSGFLVKNLIPGFIGLLLFFIGRDDEKNILLREKII